jgi:hypothetical protein
VVGPVEDRYAGEAPSGQRRPDRLLEDLAVDDGGPARLIREVLHELVDRQVSQALRRLIPAARQ